MGGEEAKDTCRSRSPRAECPPFPTLSEAIESEERLAVDGALDSESISEIIWLFKIKNNFN